LIGVTQSARFFSAPGAVSRFAAGGRTRAADP
jgi:hypothetical protein